mmetsp:Transcript_1507/g.4129  ORF Transcript_1507/g.4129 Transcript_1507/m.4129 type:complete len:261 (-) Transcript_1507:421-1203(-)
MRTIYLNFGGVQAVVLKSFSQHKFDVEASHCLVQCTRSLPKRSAGALSAANTKTTEGPLFNTTHSHLRRSPRHPAIFACRVRTTRAFQKCEARYATNNTFHPRYLNITNQFLTPFLQPNHFGLHIILKCPGYGACSQHKTVHIRSDCTRATVHSTRHIQFALETRSTKPHLRLCHRENTSQTHGVAVITTSDERICTGATFGTQRSCHGWSGTEHQRLSIKVIQNAQRRVLCDPRLMRHHYLRLPTNVSEQEFPERLLAT